MSLLPATAVGTAGMLQFGIHLPAAALLPIGIALALPTIHLIATPLQFGRVAAGLRLGPVLTGALRPFYHPVLLRTARRNPQHFHPQADQPQRQFRGEIARRAPGVAVVRTQAFGEAPAAKSLAKLSLNRMSPD